SDGFLVQTAVDGQAALDALRLNAFDGVILDIGMPRIDGLAVLHQIRERHFTMPVVIITAAEARERASLAMEAGAQAYLLKPFDAAQLKQVIGQWFGSSSAGTR
ncbi:MAG: response regulator, partial [Nitrospirae bacterium]